MKPLIAGLLTGIALWPLIWHVMDVQRDREDARIRTIIQQECPLAEP